jgi:hypothetical protein
MERIKSVDPKLWGPPAWTFLDAVVNSYPDIPPNTTNHDNDGVALEEWVNRTYLFWENLYLPCVTCMGHYERFLRENPVDRALCDVQSYHEWYKKLKREMTSTKGAITTTTMGSSSPPFSYPSIFHNVQPMPVPVEMQAVAPNRHRNPTANPVQKVRQPVGYPQAVRAKNNKPCACASRHSMTSMIQAGSANMGRRK